MKKKNSDRNTRLGMDLVKWKPKPEEEFKKKVIVKMSRIRRIKSKIKALIVL